MRRFLFLLCAVCACSPKRIALSGVADALSSTGEGGAFGRDDDPELVAAAVPFALKTMESLSDSLDDHVGLRLAMARGFTQYAYAFIQQPATETGELERVRRDTARAKKLYLRAREYGLDGLRISRGVTEAQLRAGEAERNKALGSLQKEDVPLLYWTLVPWAAAIAASKGNLASELVGDLGLVGALLDRALQLDETYDGGALHEFAMTFGGARPGGTRRADLEAHFERARALGKGTRISPLVTYAESVLTQPPQDKERFEALLNEAKSFDVDQPAARKNRLANVLAQRHAIWLLAHEEDTFP